MSSQASDLLNDFRPEVLSLFLTLKKHGFTIRAVYDGEKQTEFTTVSAEAFLEAATGVDECTLRITRNAKKDSVKTPGTLVCVRYSLYLVYGNSPGELVSDYGIPADADDAAALEAATDEHSKKWDGKKQPTVTAGERYPHIYKTA